MLVMERPALTELRQMAGRMATTTRDDQWPSADQVMSLALRALQESEGVIARLKAGQDTRLDVMVTHCMDRDLPTVMMASLDEQDGMIIRTTDTGREFEMSGRSWRERASA